MKSLKTKQFTFDLSGNIWLYDGFPHFSPKVGYHTTCEKLTRNEIKDFYNGLFDKDKMDSRIINQFKKSKCFGYLWR